MSSVIPPPNSTEGTTPISRAETPDSNAPSSLDEPINIELTAETRPRIPSGVKSCKMLVRIITLTLSKAPSQNRKARER